MSFSRHARASGSRVDFGSKPLGYQGQRAGFDAGAQHLRSLQAKVKIAQKELQISDDDYRAILLDETQQLSSSKCTAAQLIKVLDRFKARGWKPQTKKTPPKAAGHPAAMKARALWLSLYHLGAITNPSENALEAFGKRQLGCERLAWADQGQMYKLIEALKAIGEREGWDQHVTELKASLSGTTKLRIVKTRLLAAILVKLQAAGLAHGDWSISGAAIQIAGFEKAKRSGPISWDDGEIDMLARCFGDLLRTGRKAGGL